MIDILTKLGLSQSEATIYAALFEIGPCFVGPLVQKTKKHRQIVYNALESLQKNQLVTVAKKNGKNFYALGDPQNFLLNLKQKEILAEEIVTRVREKQDADQEHVEVFHGGESYLKQLANFRMHAEEAEEYIVIRSETTDWLTYIARGFQRHLKEVIKIRNKGIPPQILFFEDNKTDAENIMGHYAQDPYVTKIAPTEYKLPQTTWIAGDHIYLLTPAADPLVIHIKSRILAEQYRSYFWNVWKKATFLTS